MERTLWGDIECRVLAEVRVDSLNRRTNKQQQNKHETGGETDQLKGQQEFSAWGGC